jgi:hypothetical protein
MPLLNATQRRLLLNMTFDDVSNLSEKELESFGTKIVAVVQIHWWHLMAQEVKRTTTKR